MVTSRLLLGAPRELVRQISKSAAATNAIPGTDAFAVKRETSSATPCQNVNAAKWLRLRKHDNNRYLIVVI